MFILNNRRVSSLKNTSISLINRFYSLKNQKYSWYLLPITCIISNYGKIISEENNKFVIQTLTNNILIINTSNGSNFIRLFKNGELVLEFTDKKIDDSTFTRVIRDQKFTFKNDKLLTTEILINREWIIISDSNTTNYVNESTPFNPNFIKRNYSTLISRKTRNVWNDFIFNVDSQLFSKDLLEKLFNKVWLDVYEKFNDENHMFIIFKIKYLDGNIVTIGKIQRLNKSDKNWYVDFITNSIGFKDMFYIETQMDSILFSVGFKKGIIPSKSTKTFDGSYQTYKNLQIPVSINPLDFGKILIKSENLSVIQDINDRIINFNSFDNYNEIEIWKKRVLLIKFKDIILNKSEFIRVIDNKKYHVKNGEIVIQKVDLKTKFISKLKESPLLTNKFITLDIETFINKDNILIPYLICFFDGKDSFSFYLSDYKNVESMMNDCFKSLFIRKYNNYKIYVHNMAKFDVIFLLKYLVKMVEIEPIIHNDKFISIKVKYGPNYEYSIEFKDSYLILLASLLKLGKGFGIESIKSSFPYLFVNKNNLNYIGNIPDYKYFGNKIKYSEYILYSKIKTWNLKNESIKYCVNDCISLYQIISKFNLLIFDKFSINIHKFLTLPSLAFSIFRSNFMSKEIIPQISGKIEKDIRKGYTGGSVDVFIPRGENIKCYDVNSLYPYVMYNCEMPVGKPVYFEGDILKVDPNAFGFFYCKITAPANIKHPIIQKRHKINGLTSTISPIGNWESMIFSEEMNNAMKLGYEFEILWGYTFDRKNIFKEYVNFLYSLRLQYDKSNPLNFIAKILMNSLYGRFGMSDNFNTIKIINKKDSINYEFENLDKLVEKIDLGSHDLFITTTVINSDDTSDHNISVPIASAITAYARIHMSQFKNNPNINLYYTDTDSIYTDSELDKIFINDKILGKLKLEHICEEAIFLSPKVYVIQILTNNILILNILFFF